jgi:ABC-2 type transport system ATP-binding protein
VTNNPPVVIEGLRVVRGGREVLPGLDAALPGGAVTGLLGPSGSGKSTLLRAVVGVQRITSGRVTVLGHPAGSAALRRRVGYSTQAPAVYLDLTLAENLRYFAAVRGDGPAEVDRVLDLVGLARHRDRVAGRLSGGELGRASLAVALLGGSELLVLDEPTVGLDPVLRGELWDLFHRLTAGGVTLLVSSHVMDEAARCDELLLMRDGRILAQDTPAALVDRTGAADVEDAFVRLVTA